MLHNNKMSTATPSIEVPKVRWDLSSLYSSIEDPKIKANWDACNERADAYAEKYRGKMAGLSAADLVSSIIEIEDIYMQASKPEHYASLLFAVKADDAEITSFMQTQGEKSSEVRIKLMFVEIELQQIEEAKAQELMIAPEMKVYAHFLQRVREATPFMLTEKEEIILEETANTGVRAWVRLFDEVIAQHEFVYKAPGSSEGVVKTESEVLDMLRLPDREVRQAAADCFSEGLKQLSHILTYIFNNILSDKRTENRLRKRPYTEHSRHMANELEKETVDLVMQLCKKHEELVARYYRVKKSILGLPELTHIDRYAPLFETAEQISYDEGRKLIIDAFGDFSQTMAERANEFFEKNWIDAEPRQGKTGGAFCSYITPDLHPVIMLSYHNKMDNVSTLAHELGHGVHGSLSRAQTYFNFSGSLPLAELASIFCEQVVFEKLVGVATEEDKLALYAEKIEGVFASVFRQAAMFRFEQRCHAKRNTEGELNAEEIGAVWQEELQGMFGDSIKMGDQHARWWSYVGHFIFAPFYVYAYAFGELLTMSLYKKAQAEGPSFEKKYIEMLTLGGAKSPKELMEIVGVDMNDPEFWMGGFQAIEEMIAEFERLWAVKNS